MEWCCVSRRGFPRGAVHCLILLCPSTPSPHLTPPLLPPLPSCPLRQDQRPSTFNNGPLQPHARPGPERAEQTTLAQGAVSSHERGCYRGRGGVLHVRVTRGRMVQRRRTMSERVRNTNAPYHAPHRSNVYHAHTTRSPSWTAHDLYYPVPCLRPVVSCRFRSLTLLLRLLTGRAPLYDDARRVPPHPTYNILRCRRGWGTVA